MFFAVPLILDATTFWGPASPLAYCTAMDDSAEWFMQFVGIMMFCLNMSPWYAGVKYETVLRVSIPLNAVCCILFIPPAVAAKGFGPGVNSIFNFNLWGPQIALPGGLLVWGWTNFRSIGGKWLPAANDKCTRFCHAYAAVYVMFGVTLLTAPDFCWGPNSKFAYFTTFGACGETFARMAGALISVLCLSPHFAGMSYKTLTKILLPWNLVALPMFVKTALFLTSTGPGANALLPINLFVPQVFIQLFFLAWNVNLLI